MRSKTGQPFVGLLQLAGGGGIFLDLNGVMVSKMFASVCKCKINSKRRSTSLPLSGLSLGISKGMFLCIITAQVF